MTCKCNHEEYLHIDGGPCTGLKVSGTITKPCKCPKFIEKVIDPNHTKTLEQKRASRAADVEVVFTIGNCFNVLASKDEFDRTGKILVHAKGSVKYNGEIGGPFPSLSDWCSCPSFENGVSLDEKIAFSCKHIFSARGKLKQHNQVKLESTLIGKTHTEILSSNCEQSMVQKDLLL